MQNKMKNLFKKKKTYSSKSLNDSNDVILHNP